MKNRNFFTLSGFNIPGLLVNYPGFIRNTEYLTASDMPVFKYSRFIQDTFTASEMCTKIVRQAFLPYRMFAALLRRAFFSYRMFAAVLRQAFFPYRMFAALWY